MLNKEWWDTGKSVWIIYSIFAAISFFLFICGLIWICTITPVLAKPSSSDACRDVAAASDLSDGSIEVAKKLCSNDATADQCLRAAPAAEYAARMALQVTKRCRAALEKHGKIVAPPSNTEDYLYWSYDEPTPAWKPE